MYHSDLAYIQHHGFSSFASAAAPGLLRLLRKAGIAGGHVVDLGCGDGTWLRALIDRGYTVTGVDQSRDLLRYARAAAPGAALENRSVHRVALPQCDAITALGEVLSYAPASLAALNRLFRRAHAALRPGGMLVFDALVTGRPMSYSTWRAGPSWAVLVRVEERNNRLSRQIITFRRVRGRYRRRVETHLLFVTSRASLLLALRRAGFSVQTTRRYGHSALGERRLAFVARRRSRQR
jgi:SAM-dependent methyltransferase